MQLNQVDGGGGYTAMPGWTGDLKVGHDDLVEIDSAAHHLYNQMWDKASTAVPSSHSAAGDLSKQGFAVGAGLQHVTDRWDEQLESLMDACAQISHHMQTTKTIHANDDHYVQRQMSRIDALDAALQGRRR
ncbi:hypothetical protein ABZ636_15285 [Streptomyces sp. NPDC007251]|uniref:hypothetical protein n=1 Tax=Streptomyces sp. NPDC007251 TaxID=3154483 RepID=UPI0033D97D01